MEIYLHRRPPGEDPGRTDGSLGGHQFGQRGTRARRQDRAGASETPKRSRCRSTFPDASRTGAPTYDTQDKPLGTTTGPRPSRQRCTSPRQSPISASRARAERVLNPLGTVVACTTREPAARLDTTELRPGSFSLTRESLRRGSLFVHWGFHPTPHSEPTPTLNRSPGGLFHRQHFAPGTPYTTRAGTLAPGPLRP